MKHCIESRVAEWLHVDGCGRAEREVRDNAGLRDVLATLSQEGWELVSAVDERHDRDSVFGLATVVRDSPPLFDSLTESTTGSFPDARKLPARGFGFELLH